MRMIFNIKIKLPRRKRKKGVQIQFFLFLSVSALLNDLMQYNNENKFHNLYC